MSAVSPADLVMKKCLPCEGGVAPVALPEAEAQLMQLPGWKLTHDGQRIRKEWLVKNFMAGIDFFNRCAENCRSRGSSSGPALRRLSQCGHRACGLTRSVAFRRTISFWRRRSISCRSN